MNLELIAVQMKFMTEIHARAKKMNFFSERFAIKTVMFEFPLSALQTAASFSAD
jgi:hypothetical protein